MPDKTRTSKVVKVWVTIGIGCVVMVLCIAMTVISLILVLKLKTDITAIKATNTHKEVTKAPAQDIPATQNHTHPAPRHTHYPPTPELIAFCCASKVRLNGKSHELQIPMEWPLYNPGGHFQPDNAFHAPHKGIYSFTFGAVSRIEKEVDLYLYTKKTGESRKAKARAFADSRGSTEYAAAMSTIILPLDKDEIVSVWLANKIKAQLRGEDPPTTLFSGELLKIMV